MIKFILKRIESLPDRTLGRLLVFNGLELVDTLATLELPWLANQRRISCIPTGVYTIRRRFSQRFGQHVHVVDVPDRSWILFHVGNWPRNTDGCILPGLGFADIDNDGILEVASSRIAMNRLLNYVESGKDYQLEII